MIELIILGSSASYALPGEAAAGYLVRSGEQSLVIDLGTGSLSNLFRWQDPADIEALVLSHLHMDHVADIYPLRLYLNFDRPEKKLDVYAPQAAAEKLSCPLSPKGNEIFKKVLRFKMINKGTIQIGGFKLTFAKMVHDIPSFAVKVEAGPKSLVYSSDTSYNDNLVKLAKDADLLLAEATLDVPVAGVQHMTANEAGKIASAAKVKKLVLTHVWPTFKNSQTIVEAAKHYSGEIDLASAGKVYEI
jgi:ribonuclease BN (tRNA processing enzyme)